MTTTSTNTLTATALIHETIALNKLVLWPGNVRKTGVGTALDELAASIAAHGLLNPLTVRKAAKGKYAVVAGQRRLKALQALAQAGTLAKAEPIACHVIGADANASELSLAENVVRVAMHPADQFEAWRGLVEQGYQTHEIAARFGVAEATVRKRLALASVSPALFAAYRDGAMSLEALQAFTVHPDHAAQDSVWASLSAWEKDNPSAIRRALTEGDVPCGDRRVKFVGLDRYEAAGGAVRRDLFDSQGGGTVQDAALLDRLVMERLEAAAEDVRTEGWLWTEARLSFDWQDRKDFAAAQPDPQTLSDALQDEIDALEAEAESLDGDEADDEERLSAIHRRLDEIETARFEWPDAVKAKAGAIVSLGYDGSVEIERGLIRPEDGGASDSEKSDADGMAADDAAGPDSTKPASLPASLIEELTAQKTAALRAELAQSPALD